jgi:outer membrane protein assembly factor BamB
VTRDVLDGIARVQVSGEPRELGILGVREGKVIAAFQLDADREVVAAFAPAPTPAADNERVYVLFGSSVAAAIDFDGKLLWRKEIAPFAFDVAMGVSPILYKETMLVAWDQTNKTSRLIAFDKKTGEVKWEKKRLSPVSFCTPVVWDTPAGKQVVAAGNLRMLGYDLKTGAEKWSFKGMPAACCALRGWRTTSHTN